MVDRDGIDDEDLDLEDDEDDADELESGSGRSGTLSFMAGMVLGALVGATVALLVAPDRGDVTRRRLGRLARRVTDDAHERLDDVRDAVGKELARRRKKLRKQIEERF